MQQRSGFNHRSDDTLVLAGRAGTYRETQPIGPLRNHFQCIWTNEIHAHHTGRVAVVPDGCVDLVWMDGRIFIAGPDLASAHPEVAPGARLLGLRFQPGAAAPWLGLPMSELVGRQVGLDDVWGREARDLNEMIAAAGTTASRLRLLQSQLLEHLPAAPAPSSAMHAVFDVMSMADAEAPTIRAILHRLDISERTLRRHCHDHFGYGAKTLHRILRFQRFLRLARTERASGLSELAFAAGYADQAHLSRDIRALCGMSPSALVRQLAS